MAEEDVSIYEINLDDGVVAVAEAPAAVAKPKAAKVKVVAKVAPQAAEPLLEAVPEEVAVEAPVEAEAAEEPAETPVEADEKAEEPEVKDTTGGASTLREGVEGQIATEDIEPVEPFEELKPVSRVSRFKKADKLDEAELEQALEYTEIAHNRNVTIQEGWRRDPEFRLATLEHWERQGSLDPQHRPELEALRVKIGPKKETPKPAEAPAPSVDIGAVKKQALALRAANKDDEADELLMLSAKTLALDELRAEIAPLKASDAERTAAAQRSITDAEAAKVNAAGVVKVQEECRDFAKAYPKLVSFDEKAGRLVFKCKKFAEGFERNYSPAASLKLIAKTTLVEQGRFGIPKKPAPAPKTAPSPVHAAPAGKKKAKEDDGMYVINVGS